MEYVQVIKLLMSFVDRYNDNTITITRSKSVCTDIQIRRISETSRKNNPKEIDSTKMMSDIPVEMKK